MGEAIDDLIPFSPDDYVDALFEEIDRQFGGLDFTTREGWSAAGVLAVGAVVQAVISYVARLKIAPNYTGTPVITKLKGIR